MDQFQAKQPLNIILQAKSVHTCLQSLTADGTQILQICPQYTVNIAFPVRIISHTFRYLHRKSKYVSIYYSITLGMSIRSFMTFINTLLAGIIT